ncbi:MAG: tetratricopeptide repeat protein, partial [Candidatus Krumholzibacteria bacterium]|nr:tetratricopeptide repeat protein [Candidatus Krumholzibacteria bacterium]
MRFKQFVFLGVRTILLAAGPGLLLGAVAFCKPLLANTLNDIENPRLRRYTIGELEKGAVSLQVSARAIYRDALETLAAGDRDGARRKLLTAADLSGDLPDPMFTLARLELASGDPEGLFHLAEGARRLVRGFYGQALLAANAVILLIAAATAVLLAALVVLLIRHWPRFDHLIRERWSQRCSFPPARMIGPLLILSLLVARLGAALYASLLIAALWPMTGRREKAAILPLVVLLGACSVLAPRIEAYLPAVDEGSITRRLASLEDRGADPQLVEAIGLIADGEFAPEREYALGTLLYRLGWYEEARQHLLECVSLRGDFAPAYLNLGNVYFRQGDFSRALAGYQNVMALDSTSAVASYNIAQAHIHTMLFAESSEALQRARELGIEEYRRANPAARLLDLDIYDSGLSPSQLWSIALREGQGRGAAVLDGIFRPWLLVPLSRLWIALAAGLAGGIVLALRAGAGMRVGACDNCGRPVCASCGSDEEGVELCSDCAAVISGLSSVKVMEALLRHRR